MTIMQFRCHIHGEDGVTGCDGSRQRCPRRRAAVQAKDLTTSEVIALVQALVAHGTACVTIRPRGYVSAPCSWWPNL
jgi:hypothetical protein